MWLWSSALWSAASCFVLFCNFKIKKQVKIDVTVVSIWVAEWPPVWERGVHSVYCACSLWTFLSLWVCFFPSWFWGWDVGLNCINSWSLPFYLFFSTETRNTKRRFWLDLHGFRSWLHWSGYLRCCVLNIFSGNNISVHIVLSFYPLRVVTVRWSYPARHWYYFFRRYHYWRRKLSLSFSVLPVLWQCKGRRDTAICDLWVQQVHKRLFIFRVVLLYLSNLSEWIKIWTFHIFILTIVSEHGGCVQ